MSAVISSRTPEGMPHRCPVCDSWSWMVASEPLGDAPCPRCGHLMRIACDPSMREGVELELLGEAWIHGRWPEGMGAIVDHWSDRAAARGRSHHRSSWAERVAREAGRVFGRVARRLRSLRDRRVRRGPQVQAVSGGVYDPWLDG